MRHTVLILGARTVVGSIGSWLEDARNHDRTHLALLVRRHYVLFMQQLQTRYYIICLLRNHDEVLLLQTLFLLLQTFLPQVEREVVDRAPGMPPLEEVEEDAA